MLSFVDDDMAHSAAFGRLCVETGTPVYVLAGAKRSAAFGRLCVETSIPSALLNDEKLSRLRAAVC